MGNARPVLLPSAPAGPGPCPPCAPRSRRGCPRSPPCAAAVSAGRARRDPPAPPRRCPRRPGDAPAGQRCPDSAQPPPLRAAAPPSRPHSLARPRRAAAAQSRPPPVAMGPRCLPLLALAIALAEAATSGNELSCSSKISVVRISSFLCLALNGARDFWNGRGGEGEEEKTALSAAHTFNNHKVVSASLSAGGFGQTTVLSQQYASQFLLRKRRANSFMEESKKGNLERECIEELCNREEAREIFENNPETEYFYPKYLSCLASHRAGVFRVAAVTPDSPADLRACVKEISNQCSPLPCHKDGYKDCIDGQAKYTCVCKAGWRGENCEEDINECEDFNGGCSQRCSNFPGSFRCLCEDGYFMHSNKRDCGDINECVLHPNICGTALCKNTQGRYECECPEGYTYNSTSKNCEDIDECAENICAQLCVNSPGSYSCYCDGKKGFKLSKDMKNCESVTECIPLNLEKNYQLLYLAEQFIGIPVLYLKFKLPNVTRFTAEFDFRTYDTEGVILYAESLDNSAWILLALRDGKIEIQFKNEFGTKVTSGGKAINDGLWHIISVEELEHSISVKIAKEAVMSINSPGTLFKQSQGFLETKVYIAGLPRRVGGALVKQINPRLDGCIRAWNLMNQGHSGVNEVIQEKQSKHCLVSVERGSFYPGTGMAAFQINYNNLDSAEDWLINVTLTIRPSTDTGVMFALVSNETVPLALSIVDSNSSDSQKITVTIGNIIVAQLESKKLCTPRRVQVGLLVTKQELELAVDSHTDRSNSEQLSTLHQAMMANVVTYLGGVPDVPLGATPVTAFYNGCMEVKVNNRQLDLDEAISKHNDIRSHSCPLIMQ